MEEKQLEILKENLERRFGLLIKNSNYHALFIAKMEYLNYLFSEKIAGEVIEELIKKFKLNNSEKRMLVLGYYDYVVGKAVRQTKLETLGKDDYKKMADNCRPPFYTSFIDSELHLQEKAFFNINKLFGLDPQLVKESIKLKLEPDEILKKMKGDSKIKKATKELVEYSKNKSIKLIDKYDVEINDFSLFHFSLIEEINDLLNKYNLLHVKNTVKIKTEIKGSIVHEEEIYFKNIGIRVKGNYISSSTTKNKRVFNTKEEKLIYFLFNRFKNDKNEYFNTIILAKELGTSTAYVKNCISNINKIIKDTISSSIRIKLNVIENRRERGYHLNPKTLG